jgi:tRNA pseudouridine32 synthase/23S rRNA pseudouridine746 synthase
MLFTTAPRWRDTYQTLFRTRSINKEYIALAAPLPELPPNYRRQTRLIRGNPFFRMEETPGVANSDTVITPLETNAAHWRYKLIPTTGRKHQLRVHMAALGAPILNDPWYPMLQSIQEDDFSRPLALLAYRLAFRDPVTGEQHVFDSDRVLRSPP